MISVPMAMNVNIEVNPPGLAVSRKATSPVFPTSDPWSASTTKATMTATALTVTTWAQK